MSRARKHRLGWAVTLACVVGRRARLGEYRTTVA